MPTPLLRSDVLVLIDPEENGEPQIPVAGLMAIVADTAYWTPERIVSSMRFFSWERAAQIIKALDIQDTEVVYGGLYGDWHYNSAPIFLGGTVYREFEWLISNSYWAIPAIEYNGVFYECWQEESADEVWPPAALAILGMDVPVPEIDEEQSSLEHSSQPLIPGPSIVEGTDDESDDR